MEPWAEGKGTGKRGKDQDKECTQPGDLFVLIRSPSPQESVLSTSDIKTPVHLQMKLSWRSEPSSPSKGPTSETFIT